MINYNSSKMKNLSLEGNSISEKKLAILEWLLSSNSQLQTGNGPKVGL